MIPDQGTLKEMAPAKLLLSLYEQNQTGILYFRQSEILKVFYLNRGKISWAISSDEEDRIENVLLAKKLISPELLVPYQSNNKISQSFGKVLVENGVLSLEGLINATREQVRLIAASIMHWNSGNYQLVLESPPTRLVSLDLEIPDLVAHYIMEQMDVNIVWEELGSLSGELQQNSEPGKKNLYAIDPEQQEVLSRFSKPQRLESVLLDFPAERKYRILKILYYLLLTGLLNKKEAEKMPSLDFRELDSLFGQESATSPAEVDIEMPAMIDESEIKDIPLPQLPEMPAVNEAQERAQELPELPDLMPPDISQVEGEAKKPPVKREAKKEPLRPQPFLRPEKPKPHWRNVTFLSILLAAALAGAFLWFTRSSDRAEGPPPQKAAPLEEKTESQAVKETAAPTPEPSPPSAAAGTEKPTLDAAAPVAVEKNTQAVSEAASAARSFAAGNFRAAGELWRQALLAEQIRFSVLLEMDCLKESVRIAYRQLQDKDNFFLLNKTSRDGRSCYLVLWGRYRTADEAALGLRQLPEYFMKQSDPPSVIELEPYL